jgi:O-antigen/teichoic acid export membrane protein
LQNYKLGSSAKDMPKSASASGHGNHKTLEVEAICMIQKLLQLCKESSIYGLSGVVGSVLTVFLVPIYTRIFTPTDYGVLELIQTLLGVVLLLSVLGTDSGQSIYFWGTDSLEDKKQTITTALSLQLVMSVVIASTLYILSETVARKLLGSPNYANYIQLVAISLPFMIIGAFTMNLQRLLRKPWTVAVLGICQLVSTLGMTVWLVVIAHKGLYGVYLSGLLVSCAFAGIGLILLRKWLTPAISLSRSRQLAQYGLPLVPASVAYMIITWSDRYFLAHYTTLEQVGLYGIGNKIALSAGLVVGAFQVAWGPFAISIQKEEDAPRTYANVLTLYIAGTVGIAAALSIFAPEILRAFTPPAFHGASVVVPFLVFSVIGHGAYYIASLGVYLTKRTAHIGYTTALAAVVSIACNILLIPRWGVIGAAVASVLSQWVSALALLFVSQHYYPIPFRLKESLLILVAGVFLIVLGCQFQLSHIWLNVLVKILILFLYPVFLIMAQIIKSDHIKQVFSGPTLLAGKTAS